MGWHWRTEVHDLNQPEAKINNLELLLKKHAKELEEHLLVVKTDGDRVALVNYGQNWLSVSPNQLRTFWRGFIDVEVHYFNFKESLELPGEFVDKLQGFAINNLRKIQIGEGIIGLLYIDNNFIRPLTFGEYAFWQINRTLTFKTLDKLDPHPSFPQEDLLIEQHQAFVNTYCTIVELGEDQVAIIRHLGKVIAILPPKTRKLFWQGINVELIDVSTESKLPNKIAAELLSTTREVLSTVWEQVFICEVPPQHIALLYIDQQYQGQLTAGRHVWWLLGRSFNTEIIDLRLQNLEVSGQDILSKDKVPLRVNLTASFRIEDGVKAKNGLANINEFLYKELQFALRGAIGEKTLDLLLENKGEIDRSIAEHIRAKIADYGIVIDSVGIKDIILPGEIKTILTKVVEAEKAAQANVVRRREETAATRSMLNTAKVMEDNPVALRLKELEILERIAEKIDKIQVNGSLDNILTELIKIDRQ
jgi:regulator of protease activity HflC (stomatin/prohibitin superfamily)